MNIYLISANSYHIINAEIKKIFKTKDFLIINYHDSNIKEIINEVRMQSLFTSQKNIVVNNANFFGKDSLLDAENNLLIDYLEKPNLKNIIIFTTLIGVDKRKKISKLIKTKYQLIEISPWDKRTIRNEISKYLSNFGYQIDYETASFIINNTYENIDIIFNELNKIMLFYNKPCFINFNDVKSIVGNQIESNIWRFITSVINKDLKESISIMKNLKIYKIDSVPLVILLAREYKLMYLIKNRDVFKINNDFFSKEYNLRDWQIENISLNSKKYNNRQLLNNLSLLAAIDYKIKSGIYDKDTALYPFLLSIIS